MNTLEILYTWTLMNYPLFNKKKPAELRFTLFPPERSKYGGYIVVWYHVIRLLHLDTLLGGELPSGRIAVRLQVWVLISP